MKQNTSDLKTFMWRITASHTIAYIIAGIFALTVLKYNEIFGTGTLSFMRSTDSFWVAMGPGLQIIRGILLSLFLFPFRNVFFETKKGWIKFWLLLFGLGSLLTISAAPGSFEGLIYTTLPIQYHIRGFPEVFLYLTLFTIFMWVWYKKPQRIFNIIAVVLIFLILFMSIMGALASIGLIGM